MKIKERIEMIVKIMKAKRKGSWWNCKIDDNSYKAGFNDGIDVGIKLLEDERW